ncbi:MAG TPA: calcium-binding protein [Solirubrobacteraceae bacterium]|nr:calcium-binding protein [Solirubrobacteraceae bacterium]
MTVDPASAPGGSTVSVVASGFPRDIPVDVRWNGLSGQRLASGVGPTFTVNVTVPRVAAGAYVISVATTDEHAAHSQGVAPFEVTGSADSSTAPTPAPGATTNPPPLNPFAPTPSGGGKVITGTSGPNRLFGTSGRDVIRCGGGNDVVIAGGGNDYIDCGAGNDRVNGGAGDDEIRGGSGNDTLTGGTGHDEILGGSGNDKLFGGPGADELSGGLGIDTLRGNGGRDRLSGGPGRDILYADAADRLVRDRGDRIRR